MYRYLTRVINGRVRSGIRISPGVWVRVRVMTVARFGVRARLYILS